MLFLLMNQNEEEVQDFQDIDQAPGLVVCYITDLAEHFGNYALVHYRSGVRIAQGQTIHEMSKLGQDIAAVSAQLPDEESIDWQKAAEHIFNKRAIGDVLGLINQRYPDSQHKMGQVFDEYFPLELVGTDEDGENLYERNVPSMEVMYRDRNVTADTLERERITATQELAEIPGVTEQEIEILARPEDEEPDFNLDTMFEKWAEEGWTNGEA